MEQIPIVGGVATINFAVNQGNLFKVVVTGAVTINIINQLTSATPLISIILKQDSSGHAVTFGSMFSSMPTIPTTASSTTEVLTQFNPSTNTWYGTFSVSSVPTAETTFSAMLFAPGVGTDAQTLLRVAMPQAVVFPASASASYAIAGTAATASTVYTFKKNGSSFATATFAISGTTATWTQASASTFAVGDILEIDGPSTADATLADVGITLVGTKQ